MKSYILVFLSIFMISCEEISKKTKLFIFDCGLLQLEDISNFSLKNSDTNVRDLFVPCYLIEHPKGKLLWDAGLPIEIAGQGSFTRPNGIKVSYKKSLLDQLDEINISPDQIDFVAISHMHWDHVGASSIFPESTLLIQEKEYEAAFISPDEYDVFNLDDYSSLTKNPRVLLNGDYDVFGDGSAIILSAPGHTPGHQALLVNLENDGAIILSGDLYHFEISRSIQAVPVFNTDKEETLRSMKKIEDKVIKESAQFWIEHSLELANGLKLSPEFYN